MKRLLQVLIKRATDDFDRVSQGFYNIQYLSDWFSRAGCGGVVQYHCRHITRMKAVARNHKTPSAPSTPPQHPSQPTTNTIPKIPTQKYHLHVVLDVNFRAPRQPVLNHGILSSTSYPLRIISAQSLPIRPRG